LQKDLDGDHACHEGLMVLVMNLLKSKKMEKFHFSIEDLDCEMEGSDSEEVPEENSVDDE
jgi:hypothetical protein